MSVSPSSFEDMLAEHYPRHPRTGKLYYDPYPGGHGVRVFLLGKERAWWAEFGALWSRIAMDMLTGSPHFAGDCL